MYIWAPEPSPRFGKLLIAFLAVAAFYTWVIEPSQETTRQRAVNETRFDAADRYVRHPPTYRELAEQVEELEISEIHHSERGPWW